MKKENTPVRLGIVGLAALTFGMMVGAGIFNLPQNMAAAAGPLGSAIAWLVTAAGMLLLVMTFKQLADRHPEMKAGIYEYAKAGFGTYTGFNMAWGYWLCTAFANVAYAVMLNDTFGALFPSLLGHGWQSILFCSALIWLYFFVVRSGMKTAKLITIMMSIVKFASIALIIIILALFFRLDLFSADWSLTIDNNLSEQVRGTMMVTLWCFIGIEGASVMSGRAKRIRDIGKAGIIGFVAAWVLYALVSMLCYGVMSQAELAGLDNPSVAYVLRNVCGEWAYWLVIGSVIISLGGGWVAWTLVTAEVPYAAAGIGLFLRRFRRLNKCGIPVFGLFFSTVIMQLFLLLIAGADDVYLKALDITGMMILPCYLVSALFLIKSSLSRVSASLSLSDASASSSLLLGVFCSFFCIWMIWAGDIRLLLDTSWFYLIGVLVFLKLRREEHGRLLTKKETAAICVLAVAAVISLII